MSIFSTLQTNDIEMAKDTLGGGYQPLESGAYEATITAVYITYSSKGAMAANISADIDGREYREQLWITNAEGKNYYISKKTNKKISLPGFGILNDICLCTTGQELSKLDAETRVFKLYDYDAKQEMPKEVPTITELSGKKITLGILKQTVDKTVKNDAGEYVPSGETKDENIIDKVFHNETKMTVNEALSGLKEASFYDKWVEKNKGQTRNKAKGKQAEGTAGAPKKPAVKSLFG